MIDCEGCIKKAHDGTCTAEGMCPHYGNPHFRPSRPSRSPKKLEPSEEMNLEEFEQWIYTNYTIGDNAMARELLHNVIAFAERNYFDDELYSFLADMIPQVPDRVLRTVYN